MANVWWKLWAYYPPVGIFIAILALLAVLVPMFRDLAKMSKPEKAIWTVVMFALILLEIKSIYQDRNVHDRQQSEARTAELDNFTKIGNKITQAIRENQQNFNSVMTSTSTLLAANLGSDSFCVMRFEPGVLWWKNQAVPMFSHKGKYPLYGVNAQIIDIRKMKQLMEGLGKGQGLVLAAVLPAETDINVGDLPSGASTIMWNRAVALQDHEDVIWQINYTARNGTWQEELRASFVNGQWAQALTVYRIMKDKKRLQLFIEIDPGYPRNKDGKVDWTSTP